MKRMMKHMLLFFALLFAVSVLHSQEQYTREIWLEDFHTFVKYFQETHPDPYTAYGGRSYFMKAVQQARATLTEDTTLEEFTELLSGLIVPLGDAHSWVRRDAGQTDETNPEKYNPLVFQVATDGLFVSGANPGFTSYIGHKLLAVEGQTVDSLLYEVGKLEPVENRYGAFLELRYRLWNLQMAASLFGKKEGLTFTLQSPAGEIRQVEMPFQDSLDRVKRESKVNLSEENGLLYGQMLAPDTGYLRWNSMTAREVFGNMDPVVSYSQSMMDQIYQYYLKREKPEDPQEAYLGIPGIYDTFADLLSVMKSQQAEYLIIDLRTNGGGMTPLCLPLLYMLYGDAYLEYKDQGEYNRILSPLLLKKWGLDSIEAYNEKYGTACQWGDFLFGSLMQTSDESLEEKRMNLSLITYQGMGKEHTEDLQGVPLYQPHVIVLCSPATFSAAYHFMYFLAQIGGATVAGVPAAQAGNTFMEVTPFELPHTKISGSFSNALQIMFPQDPEKGNVYMPDFPMRWKDYGAYDFDPNAEILYVLDLIKSGRIK